MKKFAFVVVLALFIGLAVNAYAVMPVPAIKNIIYQVAAGNDMSEPPTIVVPVRYAMSTPNATKLVSGELVAWDTNSSDGTAVIKCPLLTAMPAGILVTDVLTSDQGGAKDPVGRNWGWMCIKGKCFASMDTSDGTAGDSIQKSSQFVGSVGVGVSRDVAHGNYPTSRDVIGVLLQSTSSKGSQYPVILF